MRAALVECDPATLPCRCGVTSMPHLASLLPQNCMQGDRPKHSWHYVQQGRLRGVENVHHHDRGCQPGNVSTERTAHSKQKRSLHLAPAPGRSGSAKGTATTHAPVEVPTPDGLLCVIAQHDGHKDAGDHNVAQAQHGEWRHCLRRSAREEQLDGRVKRLRDRHLRERMLQTVSGCKRKRACMVHAGAQHRVSNPANENWRERARRRLTAGSP